MSDTMLKRSFLTTDDGYYVGANAGGLSRWSCQGKVTGVYAKEKLKRYFEKKLEAGR
ncbi:hypothetical protein AAULR_02254 [Lacticaseibacillus rhamnosus MTCC 5462]|nr:hypothetical protein AAULR_02254 [Lacticaseibacillus rhamnosus MTCC 5462]